MSIIKRKFIQDITSKRWIWVLLVLIFASGIRIYRVAHKQDLNIDEAFSIACSACNQYGLTKSFDENKIYDGKTVRDSLLWDNDSLKNTVSDLVQLRRDCRDLPHSNLFYSCLRLWFTGVKTSDLQRIILQGFLLNLLFFIFSFYFMYKLAKRLFKSNWLIILTLVLAYFNPGSITNTLYLREYQLQEMLLVMMTYLFVDYYYLIQSKQKIDTWQSMIKISVLVAFVLLSGYFTTLYIAFLGIILLYRSWKQEQKQNIAFLVCTFGVALAFAGTLYCKYYDGYFGYNSSSASALIHPGSGNFTDNMTASLIKYFIDIRGYLISLPAILLLILLLAKVVLIDRKRVPYINKIPLLLSICGILWSIIVMFVISWKGVYYFMSIFPIIILLIPFLISYLRRKEMFVAIFLFISIFSVKALTRKEVYMGVLPVEKIYLENKTLPVIIAIEYSPSNLALLSYFSDDRKLEFPRNPETFREDIKKYDKMVIIMVRTATLKQQFYFPKEYLIKQHFSANWYFDGYILQKKN